MAERERSIATRRREGVEKAWARERDLVSEGRGTREWTVAEQKQILKTGRADGYEGHHMKSVAKHPEYADDPKNIQFLNRSEHQTAHKGNFRNESNGRYNERSQKIREMKDGKPRAMNSYELKNKAIEKRGYTKYAKEDARAKKSAEQISDKKYSKERVAVRKSSKKAEKANRNDVKAQNGRKAEAKAAARYGKTSVSAKPGAKQSGVKSGYGKQSSAKTGGPRTGGYGKGGQTGGKGSSSGGKGGQSSGGKGGTGGSHGGHGGSGGGHGGHGGGHGGR